MNHLDQSKQKYKLPSETSQYKIDGKISNFNGNKMTTFGEDGIIDTGQGSLTGLKSHNDWNF